MEWKQLFGKTLHGSICLWLVMNKSSVSCTRRSTYSQILCCVLDRWTGTANQTLHGNKDWNCSKVHRNTETWTDLTASQWNSSGISSQDSTRCSSVKKFKSSCRIWAWSQKILQDGLSSCRCLSTSHGDLKKMKCNANQVFSSWRDFHQDNDWMRKDTVFFSWVQTTRRLGWSRWTDIDGILRKRTPSFLSQESVVSRNAQKQRRWKIIYTFLCRWWYDWNCFSHNYFCKSATVFTEQSQIFVRNAKFAMIEQGDLFVAGQSNPLMPSVMKTHTYFWPMIQYKKKINCEDIRNELKSYPGSVTSREKILPRDENQLARKVGFEGTPELEPCWQSQPVTFKVTMEWKLELNLWTKTNLTRGSEFHIN